MINLSSLNKFFPLLIFLILLFSSLSAEEEPVDLWKVNKKKIEKENTNKNEKKKSLILVDTERDEINEIKEETTDSYSDDLVGLFDPELNELNVDMWRNSDGQEIKKILNRINNLELSHFSENLFFTVLFTNAYSTKGKFSSNEFLDFKIEWLIKNERIKDLEELLDKNLKLGKNTKVIKFLIEEYISAGNIQTACDKVKFLDKNVQNNYLDKFKIYCLIYEKRNDEAQLLYDLFMERGLKDSFFKNKINFLLGYTEESNQKILDDTLFNFYLSQITTANFKYKPNKNTNKYIWRYLSSANLIATEDIEKLDDLETITLLEKTAAENRFEKKEIFDIYLKFSFNFHQFLNVRESYKILPNYKARALVYQSILLSENTESKLELILLLKNLFENDKIFQVFSEELPYLLNQIDINEVPDDYVSFFEKYSKSPEGDLKSIKFNNKIIHQSKILKYFLQDDYSVKKTKKDIESVYKKIKKNKKYYISTKDIILLDSLKNDGFKLPRDFDNVELASKLTIPQGLLDLANDNQIGLVLLKIVEIIGEDELRDLDPETLYFLTMILNQLKLKKIRNNILLETLLNRV